MRGNKICCLACGVFKKELAALIDQGKLDCELVVLESMLHMKPARLERVMRQAMAPRPTDRFVLLYGDCHPHMHEMQRQENTSRVAGINCCEILLGRAAYRKLQKEQAFIFLPEWTLRWREVFARELGFNNPEIAQAFIQEERRRLVYADTGVIPVPDKTLAEISTFFGMPVEIRPVSLDKLVKGINSALEKFTPPVRTTIKDDHSPASQILLSDLVENILKYADNPGACAEYVTTQIRELIGVRLVALVTITQGKDPELVGICPPRKKGEWEQRTELQQFITGALKYAAPQLIDPRIDPTGQPLTAMGMGTSFVIPLRVGPEPVGMLVLLDLLDQRGASIILETLDSVSRILALILKNALLFKEMEQTIARRTRQLAESEQLFRALFEQAGDGIFFINPEGKILSVNESFARCHGYTVDEMMQLGLAGLDVEGPANIQKRLRSILAGETLTFEVQHIHRDGSLLPLEVTANLISVGAERLIIAIHRDITERKLAEAELRKMNQELDQRVLARTAQLVAANKEMHAFTYTVSHDLRAPLRHIDGFLGLLQQSMATVVDPQSRRYMRAISESAVKMGRLVDDLLAFSRMGRQVLSAGPVDLKQLVDAVIHELGPEADGRQIDWRIGDLPVVEGDATLLRMVLFNLINNALKFTRPRTQACIEIGSQSGEKTENVIYVRDNGVGFDMAYADRLFGVFQRLHRAEEFEGTGIGLATVQRIIARHGGRTWAEGKDNQGATFYFSLP